MLCFFLLISFVFPESICSNSTVDCEFCDISNLSFQSVLKKIRHLTPNKKYIVAAFTNIAGKHYLNLFFQNFEITYSVNYKFGYLKYWTFMNFQILANCQQQFWFWCFRWNICIAWKSSRFQKRKDLKNFSIISLKFFDKLHRLNKKLTYD